MLDGGLDQKLRPLEIVRDFLILDWKITNFSCLTIIFQNTTCFRACFKTTSTFMANMYSGGAIAQKLSCHIVLTLATAAYFLSVYGDFFG